MKEQEAKQLLLQITGSKSGQSKSACTAASVTLRPSAMRIPLLHDGSGARLVFVSVKTFQFRGIYCQAYDSSNLSCLAPVECFLCAEYAYMAMVASVDADLMGFSFKLTRLLFPVSHPLLPRLASN